MKKLLGKLSSRIGASVTFALLLFLVCAVVGSVVLAAGTAASGRISKLAETERKYNSVSSAASLFIDIFDGASVKRTETSEFTRTTLPNQSPTSSIPEIVGSPEFSGDEQILNDAVAAYFALISEGSETSTEKTYTLEHTPEGSSGINPSTLEVSAVETIDKDGNLEIVLSTMGSGDKYEVIMTFKADVKNESSEVTLNSRVDPSNSSFIETVRLTEDMIITWRLSDIRNGGAS